MPRPSRSTLMMPRSAQSSLSHWTTTRPGIVAGSSGTTSSSRPAAITMPPECWPRWRGRSCICRTSSTSSRTRGAAGSTPAAASCVRDLVVRRRGTRSAEQLREPRRPARGEAEHLADLAHGAPRAVGDDVRRHRRAARRRSAGRRTGSPLPPVAAREIDVDVGPLAALLGEEALEEQLHADRIDRGDAERVADGAVGRRAAPLREDAAARGRSARCPRRSGSSRRGRAAR